MTSTFTETVTHAQPSFDFVAAHFKCEENRYSESNRGGFVNFGSAQNFLHAELLADRVLHQRSDPNDAHYQSFSGTSDCRTAIANYLQQQAGCIVPASSIVVGNGIVSVLESLTIALLDEGESVLIPTPVFPGLVAAMSLRVRSRVEFLDTCVENGFRLTASMVEARLHQAGSEGKRVRAILLCSPGNPVGQVFSQSELQDFLDVAERFDCELIVDEVYAGSVFEGTRFVSAVSLGSDHVHVLGGLSKDFGLAGHATGWLQSGNEKIIAAVAKQSHFFRLPAPIQREISTILQPEWREEYLSIHRQKLSETASFARRILFSAGVRVVDSEAGLCFWLDLRDFLPTLDSAGEMQLYQQLLEQHRVHISPGNGFKTTAIGFFRICFSQPPETLREGLSRLIAGLSSSA